MSMTVLEMVRLQGAEFSETADSVIEKWIEFSKPFVSQKLFGELYERALALMVCHKMKMSGLGTNPLGQLGAISVGFTVGSVSEGGSSISFGGGNSKLDRDAEYGYTIYGVQFLNLRRMVIIPIRSGGEMP